MTEESCSNRHLNDNCSSASTLDAFEPTMSPVQSEDRSMKASLKGSKNTGNTFVTAGYIAHMQIDITKEQQHSGLTLPVVENEDQESWIKNETGKDKSWLKSQEAKEECRSCEVHVSTIDHLQSKRKKDKEKKRELTQKCDNLQKQCDDSRKECDDLLRKRISDIHEMNTLQKNVTLEESLHHDKTALQLKINGLETENSSLVKKMDELKQQFKIVEENQCRDREEEKKALMEKLQDIQAQAERIPDLEQKHRDREEEKKSLMEKLQDFQAQAERIPDLEQKYKDSKEGMMALQEQVNGVMKGNDDLTREKSSLEKEVGQRDIALESSRRKNANQRRIHHDMNNKIDELEQQAEQLKTQLTAVVAQLNAVTAQSNNLRTYNNELLRIADAFYTRFQVQEEDGHAFHDELREIINGLRRDQVPHEPVDITVLFVQHDRDVHVPD
ncbi:Hypothetical predicted protein [Paramuricea clavata]|uniref:Uncharacterized protein n=1 Tax=Paramuricea clavata TaxID=317549 RepID=A0A7D9I669_PARCT|nr:Hypothetical predicted protein [Paramuricea clavata]